VADDIVEAFAAQGPCLAGMLSEGRFRSAAESAAAIA
jgi:hypothetical protein